MRILFSLLFLFSLSLFSTEIQAQKKNETTASMERGTASTIISKINNDLNLSSEQQKELTRALAALGQSVKSGNMDLAAFENKFYRKLSVILNPNPQAATTPVQVPKNRLKSELKAVYDAYKNP